MANIYFTPLCLGSTITSKNSAPISQASSYIVNYAPIAQSLSNSSGIPASVILGVALIESGHGSSQNCIMLKNHFGIKGINHLPKKGINYFSVYRSYSTDEASYGHFCTLLKRKSYFTHIKGIKDYKLWLLEINKGHYSTAGMIWVNRIKDAIEKHKLYRFDQNKMHLSHSPKFNWLHS
jgi:Bax protein